MRHRRRSAPLGGHRPVMVEEALAALDVRPGMVAVDATVGWAGHACALLKRIGAEGKLIGLDLDPDNLPRARERLLEIGGSFTLHAMNFAGLPTVLAQEGLAAVDGVLADLGMSSMQVDDPERGFSYVRDGPLDMRMDRTRGRTAAELLANIAPADLAQALRALGDEPEAERVARVLVAARQRAPILRTSELARVLLDAGGQAARPSGGSSNRREWQLHPTREKWNLHPAARTFQTLRILVNRELANLEQLLRVLPGVLRSGGRAVVISFHSGEDRLVKAAFRDGLRADIYQKIAEAPLRPGFAERQDNPRSRSAKLRWARRS